MESAQQKSVEFCVGDQHLNRKQKEGYESKLNRTQYQRLQKEEKGKKRGQEPSMKTIHCNVETCKPEYSVRSPSSSLVMQGDEAVLTSSPVPATLTRTAES